MPYCPIGFHTGPGGNPTGIGEYFQKLDAAGRPAVLKSVDAYGFCRELATLRQQSGVPHVIIFRLAGGDLELPDMTLPPDQSAREHWQRIRAALPPEMEQNGDQDHVWLEVMNEPDKNQADWLGRFMVHCGQLALADGFKLCGPGWSTGEPEPEHWREPGWQDYLRLCAANPGRLAIALHEYSLSNDDIMNQGGFLVGRFQQLFAVCDDLGITRPEVLITEWGWNATTLPDPTTAMNHIRQAANLYKQHPQILGAAIWYLGPGFDGIANLTQPLISPVLAYALGPEWDAGEPGDSPCRGTPRVQYSRVYQLIHGNVADAQAIDIFRAGLAQRRTTGWSADDAGIGDLDNRSVDVFHWPNNEQPALTAWYRQHYPGVAVTYRNSPNRPGRTAFTTTLPVTVEEECRGAPRVQYGRVYQLVHDSISDETAVEIFRQGLAQRRTTGWSYDDAGIGDLDSRTVEIFGAPANEHQVFRDWYAQHYPGVQVVFRDPPAPPPTDFWLENPVARDIFITSFFNEPRDYDGDGIFDDLHEGIDFAGLLNGQPVAVKAAQIGVVSGVFDRPDGYGKHIIIRHEWPDGNVYSSWYGHLSQMDVEVGQNVAPGQTIGITGDTGNSEGVHLHLTLQHHGHGLPDYVVPDVVDPLPFLRDSPPPPPTGEAWMGLHASADPVLAPGEVQAFTTARIELIKCLSNLDPAGVSALANALPNARWVVRAFLSMAGRVITPAQFVNDTINDVQRTLNLLPGRDVWVELHNEPNLVAEGMGSSWADGTAFRPWFLDVLSRYRTALPGVRFLYPGLSPGGSVPGIRQDHMQFLSQSKEAVRQADGFGAHIYWAFNFPMSTALRMLDDMLTFLRDNGMSNKPVFVTEASNNKGNTTPAQKGAEYVTFWRELIARPVTKGVTYFVASANHPDFQEEVWVTGGGSRGIAEVVGVR